MNHLINTLQFRHYVKHNKDEGSARDLPKLQHSIETKTKQKIIKK